MTAISAVDMRIVGVILDEVEAVLPAIGAAEFYTHTAPNTHFGRFCFGRNVAL